MCTLPTASCFNVIYKFMQCNMFTEDSVMKVMLLHSFWHTCCFQIMALWLITESDVEEMTLPKHGWHKFSFKLGLVLCDLLIVAQNYVFHYEINPCLKCLIRCSMGKDLYKTYFKLHCSFCNKYSQGLWTWQF